MNIEWGEWRHTKKIATLDELLIALTPQHWGTGAEMYFNKQKSVKPELLSSSDHNYYYSHDRYAVEETVAQLAIDARYVQGIPKWGYTSEWEWKISERGREKACEIRARERERKKNEKLVAIVDQDPGDSE